MNAFRCKFNLQPLAITSLFTFTKRLEPLKSVLLGTRFSDNEKNCCCDVENLKWLTWLILCGGKK